MLVIRRSANARNAALRADEYSTITAWAAVLRAVMIDGLAVARALGGYALSTVPALQPSGNVSVVLSRDNATEYLTRFPRFASLLASQKPAVALQAICPGGVIAMTYPHDAETVGRDLMSPNDPTNQYRPTTLETVLSGRYSIVGPRHTTIASLRRIWVISTRAPLYMRTLNGTPPSLANFWGFVLLIVNVTGALDVIQLDTLAKAKHLNYVIYDLSKNSSSTRVIASSLPPNTTQETYEAFISDSTVMDILAPLSSLYIAVRSRQTYVSLTATNVTIITLWTLFGSLLLLAIAIAAVLWCTRVYDGTKHAPKMAPFAMLTIGPCRGEELWDLAAEQMAEVTDRLDGVLVRQMVRHGAYQIQQVHPLTTSYVTRSVAAAVQMAFSAIEELQRRPIDGPLRAVLGDEGRLLLSYAVHWCTDAAVRVESLDGTYRYEGPDVVFGGRMWAFAAPSVLTASEAVAQALPRHGLSGVVTQAYQMVTVVHATAAKHTDGNDDVEGGIRDATSTNRRSGSMMLYLLAHAAKPNLLAAAAEAVAAAVATVPQLMIDNANSSSPSSYPIMRMNSSSLGAREAVSGLQDGSARPMEAFCPASTTCNLGCTTLRGCRRGRSPLSDGALQAEQKVVVQSRIIVECKTDLSPEQPRVELIEADAVTRALLQPFITRSLDVALRAAFDYQFITLDIRYDEVRVLVYYFYSSYNILFRPLAAPERHNIFRRLVTAFGVPQQGILEHLAARGAMQWLSQVRKINGFMYQQVPLECNSPTTRTPATTSPCGTPPEAKLMHR
ncbi:hypothetical protein LPMP_090310 [Leishmania panamensis]|uniref:Nucleotide cyclase, putative n=1 Tax=Leishmania panamensis TaxID=5679 RepID=A0A088RIY6_LEIPA|nr:hypothetical protein LPMP_090310 [Leishmania panamensis]AIN95947.1 hypothetical protein LPMP_090310 [Leishmania panamensis]